VASREACSTENEQNIVTVEGAGSRVVFKQIAGLIARRIVFNKKPATAFHRRTSGPHQVRLARRRALRPEWEIVVRPGMRVAAGSSVIARRRDGGQAHGT